MPLISKLDSEEYSIALWKIEEDEQTLCSLISNFDDYKEELQNFKSSFRRREWLAVRACLDSIYKGEKIVYKDSGKPYLLSGNYNISISHTGSYVSVIVSQNREVSIDIEKYGQRVEKVASRFVRDDEEPTCYNGDKIWALLLHWSAKESAYKIIDLQNIDFKKHLLIYPFEVNETGEFLLKELKTEHQDTYLINYKLYNDFVMTWTIK